MSKGNAIRIISGAQRGRRMPVLDLPGLRPTGNRQREVLFNWLQGHIVGARCLDVFAGTGALALEALSRDAREVVCLENNESASQALQGVLDEWGLAGRAEVHAVDALWFLGHSAPRVFDIVFIDPPFDADSWQATLDALVVGWIRSGSLIYLEYPAPHLPVRMPADWRVAKARTAGRIGMTLFEAAIA